jgi:nitrogen fixation protein NifQ
MSPQPADVYTWIAGTPRQGCDAFDAHVVASILAIAVWEAETGRGCTADAVGLDGDDIVALAGEMFPHTEAVFARIAGTPRPPRGEDESCLRELLWRNASGHSPLQRRLADMIARRCLRPNHLWQDLGLRSRRELGWLMNRHFEPLAARNRADMKWKKFFYRTICRDDGFTLCAAPSCAECDDFEMCFGDESGESLLARSRRAADLAA